MILCGFRGIVHNEIFELRNKDGLMTGKTSTDLSSVLPLDARTARIAAECGTVASMRRTSSKHNKTRDGFLATGYEQDELDFIAPQAAEKHADQTGSIPRPPGQNQPYLNSNPI